MSPLLKYSVTRSPRRRTLAIEVRPDLSIAVLAPADSGDEEIAAKVAGRRRWIVRQQEHFRRYHPLPKAARFVSGETHYHLGRQYQLRVVGDMPRTMVGIAGEYLEVLLRGKATATAVERAVTAWYRTEAKRVLGGALAAAWLRLRPYDVPRPALRLRTMPGRWGSCTAEGAIAVNPNLVRVPVHCIDYVLIHELCHLRHHNHGVEFYRLLNRVLPNWKTLKRTLEKWSEVIPQTEPNEP